MASEAMNDLVAAMLSSGPAAIGKMTSQMPANGLLTSLTMATVVAPADLAMALNSVRSSLRPDCEMVSSSWSFNMSCRR
jgi:hypothetical protein